MPQVVFTAVGGSVKSELSGQEQGLQKVASASRAAARAERERGAAMHAAHRAPSGARQLSIVGRLMGGEGGKLLREGAHFSHLAGGFALAGAAAIAVGLTFKALAAASARAVEAAREEAKVRIELRNAIHTATKAADQNAIGAFSSHRDALTTLAATGGDAAVSKAQGLARRFGPDAIGGAAALAGSRGGLNERDIDAASAAARTGRVSFGAAAQAIAGGNVSATGSADERAAQILSGILGQAVNVGDVRGFQASLAGSKIGRRAGKFDAAQGGLTNAGINRFASSDSLIAGIDKQTSDLTDPAAGATRDLALKLDEQIEIAKSAKDAQWRIVAGFEDLLGFFGGGGSEGTQLERLQTTRATVHE